MDRENLSQGYKALPEGNYGVILREAVFKPAKKQEVPGTQVMVLHTQWEIRIDEGPIEFAGRKLRKWYTFHPETMWSVVPEIEDLTNLDWDDLLDESGEFPDDFVQEVVGTRGTMYVELVPDNRNKTDENGDPVMTNNCSKFIRDPDQPAFGTF